MSQDFDPILEKTKQLFLMGAVNDALEYLQAQDSRAAKPATQRLRVKALAWLNLNVGQTEKAYELFWSSAHFEGAKAGILLLTVLSGQVITAMGNWLSYCTGRPRAPLEIPDEFWHTEAVCRPAIDILKRHHFHQESPQRAASMLYIALLYRAIGNAPEAFGFIAEAATLWPAASIVREKWLEQTVGLPAPKGHTETKSSPTVGSAGFPESTTYTTVLNKAQMILLYPEPENLRTRYSEALTQQKWLDALEILRRLLFLDPQDTESLENRWRLLWKLQETEQARDDLLYLVELYEKRNDSVACLRVAHKAVELFEDDERPLLRLCFLYASLARPEELSRHGIALLERCRRLEERGRFVSYQRWLLRQQLTLDGRTTITGLNFS